MDDGEENAEDQSTRAALDQELERALTARARMQVQLNRVEQRIDELHRMADEVGREPLLPEDIDLLAGTITIRDREGTVVGEYRIDGGNVSLALESLEVSRVEEP